MVSNTLEDVRDKIQTFEEPIVDAIIRRYHYKKTENDLELLLQLDNDDNYTHPVTKISVNFDMRILDMYKHFLTEFDSENKTYQEDQYLVDLIACRTYYGKEIAEIKFKKHTAIFLDYHRNNYDLMQLIDNPEIEHMVLKRVMKYPFIKQYPKIYKIVDRLFAEMIKLNKEYQVQYILQRIESLRVGFLGPEGTYASQVAGHLFNCTHHSVASESNDKLFEMLDNNEIDMAVVPIRNNLTGIISEIDEDKYKLVKMIDFAVVIDILGKTDIQLDKVEKLYSHQQTYEESKEWISKNLPNALFVPAKSTVAASIYVSHGDGKSVALSSRKCASQLGLQVLVENVVENSTTTFFIISKD